MKTIYITSWYYEPDIKRKEELVTCIKNTIDSKEVDKVVLLVEKGADSTSIFKGVKIIKIDNRPTYNDFFKYANEFAENGDIVIVSNTDIYPEKGTKELISSIGNNECYALSRWDEDNNGNKVLLNSRDTADVWIFKAPIKDVNGDFCLGVAGCDNAIGERLYQANYKVSNPSKSVKFNHLHNSGVRTYNANIRVSKPYLLISPHNLNENSVLDFINI